MKFVYGKFMTDEFIKNKLAWNSYDFAKKIAKRLSKKADTKIKSCSICNGAKFVKKNNVYGINYMQCVKCDSVSSDRVLSKKQLDDYFKNSRYPKKSYTDKKIIKMRDELLKPKVKFVTNFIKKGKWLDVGAAEGSIVDLARKEGFDAHGIEISSESRKFAKKYRKIDLYSESLESFFEENKSKWDIISFFGLFEVIPDPMNALKIANKMLRKGGIIVVQVTNFDSGSTLVQHLVQNTDRHLYPPLLFRLFTFKSLKFCFKKTGFNPISTWYHGMDMIELIKYLRNKDKKFAYSPLDDFLISNLNEFQQIFDNHEKGDTITMIGKKN
jgi:2-polyprenyl-3-methyl-5-hydroxy-6-metoxy-1,4-benzoquinol methylase